MRELVNEVIRKTAAKELIKPGTVVKKALVVQEGLVGVLHSHRLRAVRYDCN
jgi:hypothetical protein